MLSALARRAGWVFVVALAIARSDGRAWSRARAVSAAAEVGWLLLALDDNKPARAALFVKKTLCSAPKCVRIYIDIYIYIHMG